MLGLHLYGNPKRCQLTFPSFPKLCASKNVPIISRMRKKHKNVASLMKKNITMSTPISVQFCQNSMSFCCLLDFSTLEIDPHKLPGHKCTVSPAELLCLGYRFTQNAGVKALSNIMAFLTFVLVPCRGPLFNELRSEMMMFVGEKLYISALKKNLGWTQLV